MSHRSCLSWHLEQVEITDTKTGQVGGGRGDSECGGAIVVSHRSCLSWHLEQVEIMDTKTGQVGGE